MRAGTGLGIDVVQGGLESMHSSCSVQRQVRAACHLAAVTPFLVACGLEMARGWRPTGDDANITFRSWDVLSSHSPLVGQFSQAGVHSESPIYDLGPLLYWLLTVPVHLDHSQGALWGAAILCAAGAAVAVEAAWSARGWSASVAVATIVLAMVAVNPQIALDPTWNPDVGLVWFVATGALAWAVASGHLRWWPVLVVVGSFTGQSHLMFAVGSIACIVVAQVIGFLRARATGWWVPTGVLVGMACWAAPTIQQLTTHPGNLTLLARFHGSEQPFGTAFGLRSLAAAVGPVPVWTGRPGGTNPFVLYDSIQAHAAAAGVAVLVGLLAIAVGGWMTARLDLAAAAAVVLVLSVSLVWTCASVPYGSLTIAYIDTSSWPVGMAAVLAAAWALGELGLAGARRLAATQAARRRRTGPMRAGPGWAVLLGAATVALGAVATVIVGSGIGSSSDGDDPWATVAQMQGVSHHIEQVVPPGRVAIVGGTAPGGQGSLALYGLITGLVWELYADGWRPETSLATSAFVVPQVAPGPTLPPATATISYGGSGSTARVVITNQGRASLEG